MIQYGIQYGLHSGLQIAELHQKPSHTDPVIMQILYLHMLYISGAIRCFQSGFYSYCFGA